MVDESKITQMEFLRRSFFDGNKIHKTQAMKKNRSYLRTMRLHVIVVSAKFVTKPNKKCRQTSLHVHMLVLIR